MPFLDIFYMMVLPCIVLCNWSVADDRKKYVKAVLAVLNLLMILYALFFLRQAIGIIQWVRATTMGSHGFNSSFAEAYGFVIRCGLVVILPFLFLFRKMRANILLSLLLCVLLWCDRPFSSWNMYDLGFKILNCFSLWCAAYALLWLLRLLPFQSSHVFTRSDRI